MPESVLFYLTRFCLHSGQARVARAELFPARSAPWMWELGQCQQRTACLNFLVGSATFDQKSKPCRSFAHCTVGMRQRMESSAARGGMQKATAFGVRTDCKGWAG